MPKSNQLFSQLAEKNYARVFIAAQPALKNETGICPEKQ